MDKVDGIVIGGGVVGLAIARAMALDGREVIVLEAEAEIGSHTSSRNSEVIHAGIYYPTGSLKAKLCVEGKERLYEYCRTRQIRYRRTGKLIVATTSDEIAALERYRDLAAANGVHDLEWLDAAEVARLEPEVKCAAALRSPSTGIIDSHEFMVGLQGDLEAAGGSVICRSRVSDIAATRDGFMIQIEDHEGYALTAGLLVNAAGLWAPEVARGIRGIDTGAVPKSFFAKGHYYSLTGKAPFSHLIYPVAGQAGLGIHLTLDLAGQGRFGPDVQWIDEIDYRFDKHRKPEFVRAIQRYYPGLDETRLVEGLTGIRPKISGPEDSPADFEIQGPNRHGLRRLVNLFGIESPGLTASLAIADRVAKAFEKNR
jgi:L-2-hydroxyglutarate oxidase LhgO